MSRLTQTKKFNKLKKKAKQEAVVLRLKGETSCEKCQYFYSLDASGTRGIWDRERTVYCAIDRNPRFTGQLVKIDFWEDEMFSQVPEVAQGMCAHYIKAGPNIERHPNVWKRITKHQRKIQDDIERAKAAGSSETAG